MDNNKEEAIVQRVFDLYDRYGHEAYIGEAVTQLQHAQQCAQEAIGEGQPDHAVIGAFLHDVGHLVGLANKMEAMSAFGLSLGTKTHEKVGEEFLRSLGFPPSVTDFVRGHVDAKRYLVFKDPEYHATLSKASQGTLINQGGPMTAKEAGAFEKHADFSALISMRHWDDKAKNPKVPIHDNGLYMELCRKVLLSNQ